MIELDAAFSEDDSEQPAASEVAEDGIPDFDAPASAPDIIVIDVNGKSGSKVLSEIQAALEGKAHTYRDAFFAQNTAAMRKLTPKQMAKLTDWLK